MISKSILAKNHIAKQQLGMDESSYRAMLHSVAGVSSVKDLDAQGAVKVMRHLERCGFKPVHSHGRRPPLGLRACDGQANLQSRSD